MKINHKKSGILIIKKKKEKKKEEKKYKEAQVIKILRKIKK